MIGGRKIQNYKKYNPKILNTTKSNTNSQQVNEIQLLL